MKFYHLLPILILSLAFAVSTVAETQPGTKKVDVSTPRALVKTYLEAALKNDGKIMYSLMSKGWRKKSKATDKSFTTAFQKGYIKLKSYSIRSLKIKGDTAYVTVAAVITFDEGDKKQEKGESMHFRLVRKNTKWIMNRLF